MPDPYETPKDLPESEFDRLARSRGETFGSEVLAFGLLVLLGLVLYWFIQLTTMPRDTALGATPESSPAAQM